MGSIPLRPFHHGGDFLHTCCRTETLAFNTEPLAFLHARCPVGPGFSAAGNQQSFSFKHCWSQEQKPI